jgi:hypothetical protein
MRRLQLGLLGAGLPFFALSLAIVGCGTPTTPTGGEGPPPSQKTDTKVTWIDPGKGVITGKVTLKGKAPIEKLNTELQAAIDKTPKEKEFCLSGPKEDKEQAEYLIGADNGVQNVVVWIMPEDTKNTFFQVTDAAKSAKDVTFDQPFCAFHPRVAIAFPQYHDPADAKGKLKPTGEKIVVKNSAQRTHNTKYGNSGTYLGANPNLEPGAHEDIKDVPPSYKEPINFQCNIHGWMHAYLWAFDHPYAAITDKDGNYKIENVPTSVKVKIVAWHESGFLKDRGGEPIELIPETTKNFELTPKGD